MINTINYFAPQERAKRINGYKPRYEEKLQGRGKI